jgi:hypothetical protein|tara:strand:- start:756 stop:1040 length:285 start_codon:yes stop_codon:yes gene_type:complete
MSNTDTLIELKDNLECFELSNQARALRIIINHSVSYDENANGVFVNMSNVQSEVIEELQRFVGYVNLQQQFLQDQEKEKDLLRENYFKTCADSM